MRTFVSDGAGVGRSAPLHPLVRSRGLVWRGIGFPLVREAVPVGISFLMDGVGASVLVGVWFSTARGALLPYTPSGTWCEKVATLSRSPGGWFGGELVFRWCGKLFRWEFRF